MERVKTIGLHDYRDLGRHHPPHLHGSARGNAMLRCVDEHAGEQIDSCGLQIRH